MKVTILSILSLVLLSGCNVHLKGEADIGIENPYVKVSEE